MERYDFDFATWSDFVDHANFDLEKEKALGYCQTDFGGRNIRYDFQHVRSFDEAVRLASAGWREGVKKSQEISSQIERRLVSKIERDDMNYDLTGEVLDIGRFCAGEPEHWGVWSQTYVDGPGTKLVHVVVNGTASAVVDKSILIARGAAIAALVNLMELAGYRAKITLCYATKAGSTIKVSLKDHDVSLDEDKLAYALTHPATFRCLGFSVWDSVKSHEVQSRLSRGYDCPIDLPPDERGDVYLGMMHGNDPTWSTVEASEKWVTKTMENLGILKPETE